MITAVALALLAHDYQRVFDRREEVRRYLGAPDCETIAKWYYQDAWALDAALSDRRSCQALIDQFSEAIDRSMQDCMSGPLAFPRSDENVFNTYYSFCRRYDHDGDFDVDLRDWSMR